MGTFPSKRFERIDFVVLSDRSGSDNSKVAVSGATVAAYARGTDTRNATGSPIANSATGTINIQHPGELRVGDSIFKNTSTSQTVSVTVMTQNADLTWTITVSNSSGSSFTWTTGDRLMISSRRPALYSDAAGQSYLGSSTTSDSNGMVGVYTNAPYIDAILSGGTPSIVAQIKKDIPGGERPVILNLNDYGASLNTALAAIATETYFNDRGVEIFCPPGVYTYDTSELPVVIDTRVTIRGGGHRSTIFQVEPVAGNEDLDFFQITNENVEIADLAVQHCGPSLGAGDGHIVNVTSTSTTIYVRLSNLNLSGSPNSAVRHGTNDSAGYLYTDFFLMERCRIGGTYSGAHVEVGSETTLCHMTDCSLERTMAGATSASGVYCLLLEGAAQVRIENSQFGPSSLTTQAIITTHRASATGAKGWGAQIQILGCDLEKAALGSVTTESTPLIQLEGCSGVVVRDTLLFQFGSGLLLKDCYAPLVENLLCKEMGGSGYEIKVDGSKHALLQNCFYEYTDTAPDNGARRPISVTKANDYSGLTIIGNGVSVSYYADDTARDATSYSAGTDVKGARHDKGTVIWVDSPTSPTSKLQVYNGSAWVGIGNQSGTAIT